MLQKISEIYFYNLSTVLIFIPWSKEVLPSHWYVQ